MYSVERGVSGRRPGRLVRNPVFDESQQDSNILFRSGPMPTPFDDTFRQPRRTLAYPYFTSSSRRQEPETKAGENDHQPSDVNEADSTKSCHSILKNQALEISTAHGYPIIYKAETWFAKLIWSLIFLAAIGAFVRQTYFLMDRYFDFPVTVELAVVSRTTLDFPAVTVCNTNKVRRSAIAQSKHKQVLTVDDNTPTAYKAPCSSKDFTCLNRMECTKNYLVCDGIRHCSDNSDEITQGCIYGNCGDDHIKCTNGSDYGACIDKDRKCDNIAHCYDAEDELGCDCRTGEFKCKRGICIHRSSLCNKIKDCLDDSDEDPMLCDPELLREEGWKCGLSLVYVAQLFVCDKYPDCEDESDETDVACAKKDQDNVCEPDQFSCEARGVDATLCMPKWWVCDGVDDQCKDFADESRKYCPDDFLPPITDNCPADFEVNYLENSETRSANVSWDEPTAIDNFGSDSDNLSVKKDVVLFPFNLCDGYNDGNYYGYQYVDLSSGDFFEKGYYSVVYTFSDTAGHTAFCYFDILVCPAPELIMVTSCPENIVTEISVTESDVEVTYTLPTATSTTVDATTELTPQLVEGPNDYRFPRGTTLVVYEFDGYQVKTCSFTVTIIEVDDEIPAIEFCPDSYVYQASDGGITDGGGIIFEWDPPRFDDHSDFGVSQSRGYEDYLFYPGITKVTFVAEDIYANVNTCEFTVTVADATPPRVTCQADIIRSDVPRGITGRFVDWEEPNVSDLSTKSGSVVTLLSQSHKRNSFFPLQTTVVSYRYQDWAGNKESCRFNITLVQDLTKTIPMFDCTDGQIIPMWKTCNNIPDCEDGDDEQICGTSTVTCNANSRPCREGAEKNNCILNKYECNFVEDCVNGGDELYCDFPDDCGDNYFQCKSSHVCLHRYAQCNGVWDCIDGTDEKNCFDRATEESPFVKGWYLEYSQSLSTNYDFQEMASNFEQNVYQGRGFHRVKGENPPDWNTFVSFSSRPDFSELADVLLLHNEEIARYGHQADDLILQCTYNEQECNTSELVRFVDDRYGNCFTFNYVNDSNKQPVQSTRAGSAYGLKMTLFLEQSEYLSIFGREAGIRVSIHPSDTIALPADDGITIRPGTVSSIGLRYENVSRLGGKYSRCIPDESVWDDLRDGTMVTIDDERYDRKRCLRTCLHINIYQACGCSDTIELTGRRCKISNSTEDLCRQYIRYLHDNNALDCNCGQACNDRYFTKTVSQSLWPSNIYLKHLLRTIHSISNKTNDINDGKAVRENLARFEVFFEELNYAVTKEVPGYLTENLFSDVGGTVGLYIGFSMITVCEFAAVALLLLRYMCSTRDAPKQDRERVNTNTTPREGTRQGERNARGVNLNYHYY